MEVHIKKISIRVWDRPCRVMGDTIQFQTAQMQNSITAVAICDKSNKWCYDQTSLPFRASE